MKFIRTIIMFILLMILPAYAHGVEISKIKNPQSAVVFMYHHFGDSRYPSTNIRLDQFEHHLEYLQKNDYNIFAFSKIVNHLLKGKQLPPKTVALTMDDAYISVFTEAYPRLKKLKWPFTVFVNSEPVDLKFKNFMSWEQMREMQKNGAEFANHSLSHAVLLAQSGESETVWKERIIKEVKDAQKRIQEELGDGVNEDPRLFSYPYGEYSIQTATLIENLGYIGVSQTSGPVGMESDLQALPRFAMSEAFANHDGFVLKLQTKTLPILFVSPRSPIIDKQNPPILKMKLKRNLKDMRCYLSSGKEITLEWISKTDVIIQAKEPLELPRDRYTCTARANSKQYYWYSHLWIIKSDN